MNFKIDSLFEFILDIIVINISITDSLYYSGKPLY